MIVECMDCGSEYDSLEGADCPNCGSLNGSYSDPDDDLIDDAGEDRYGY